MAILSTFLVLLALSPWCLDCVRLLDEGLRAALKPYPTCITELFILDGARCVSEGRTLYPPVGKPPFVIHVYNPLTYLGAGLAGRWLRLDLDGLLVAGRLISFASAIGILAVLGGHLWMRSRDWRVVLFLVAMVAGYHTSTLTDFFRNRPETPGILFSVAGWVVAQQRPRGWPFLAAACFGLAFAFKQSFVSAPLAVAVQLTLERDVRSLLRMASATAALDALVMFGGMGFFGRGYLEHTVFAMSSNPMHLVENTAFFYGILAREHWGLLLPAAMLAVAWLLRRDRRDPLVIYLGACALLTTLIHAKVGADINYHGELSLLMVLAVVSATSAMIARRSPLLVVPLVLLTLAVWLPIFRHGPGWNGICPSRIHPTPHCSIDAPPFGDMTRYEARYRGRRGPVLFFQEELAVRSRDPQALDWLLLEVLFEASPLNVAFCACFSGF
jgi:hypothetical protein